MKKVSTVVSQSYIEYVEVTLKKDCPDMTIPAHWLAPPCLPFRQMSARINGRSLKCLQFQCFMVLL